MSAGTIISASPIMSATHRKVPIPKTGNRNKAIKAAIPKAKMILSTEIHMADFLSGVVLISITL